MNGGFSSPREAILYPEIFFGAHRRCHFSHSLTTAARRSGIILTQLFGVGVGRNRIPPNGFWHARGKAIRVSIFFPPLFLSKNH